jgi:hypothetical protein
MVALDWVAVNHCELTVLYKGFCLVFVFFLCIISVFPLSSFVIRSWFVIILLFIFVVIFHSALFFLLVYLLFLCLFFFFFLQPRVCSNFVPLHCCLRFER